LLAPDALVCGSCHALVHAGELEQLAATARLHEQRGESAQARDTWASAMRLLPADAGQAHWMRGELARLDSLLASRSNPSRDVSPELSRARRPDPHPDPSPRNSWAGKFGPLAPLVILLANGKFLLALLKFKFLLSLGAFIAFYWALYGAKFGVGFAVLILVHEMGHFLDIKRRGLPADMPVFMPGFGAYVRWTALGVSAQTRAFVSLAGPLAGCLGSAVCAFIWTQTGDGLWIGLASLSALLNVLNLIPVWVLDGGQAIAALDKTGRIILAAAAVLLAGLLGQPVLLLVAAGAVYRLFTKDIPTLPDHAATAYYVALLAALGYLVWVAPPAVAGR
jgi:Zn-dependent protease